MQRQRTANTERTTSQRRSSGAKAISGLAALLTLVTLGYVGAAAALAGEMPPATRVAGVDIGGLSPAQAEARLRAELADVTDRSLTVQVDKQPVQLRPSAIGLSVDIPATVSAATMRWPSPVDIVRSFFGRHELPLKVKVNEEQLKAAVAALARKVDKPAREGEVVYQGLTPRAVAPAGGLVLDQAKMMAALRAAYPHGGSPLRPTMTMSRPTVSAVEIRRVAATTARTAVAAPLILTNGSRQVTIPPEKIAAYLRFRSDGKGKLRPSFNAERLAQEVQDQLIPADRAPKDATFTIVNGKPRVVPSKRGETVDARALANSVADAIEKAGNRTIAISVVEGDARLTTQQARTLGVKEKVSSFTTYFPCCAPRVTNIQRIADIVDGHLVLPGETFSLNGLVGRRDKARGFVEAPMILNGRFVNDVGGGISQFATTMFNAVFFGGFEDVQHTPHTYYISRYPAGRESTVSFPQPDFRWRNDSPYGVLVTTSYTSTSVTVQFWSTKRYDIESQSSQRYGVTSFPTISDSGEKCIPMEGAEGFSIDVWRIFKKDGRVLRKQKFHTVYAPEPRLVCRSDT